MLGSALKKIFGSSNDRIIRSFKSTVNRINELEEKFKNLSDQDLAKKTIEFKERLSKGESLDSILPEAFAVVRLASIRTLKMRHFDVQLIGGLILHQGKIAEMKTGEGKTLVATLAVYLNALAAPVHVVTVNDYLAKRDSEWMGSIYKFLGLSVGCVYAGMKETEKRAAYAADVTYGQNNEFGFDYLRDNMKYSLEAKMQRGHHFAIVDEVDSILIDEARTPLIISGPAEDSSQTYYTANKIIPNLKASEHYEIDLKSKHPSLNETGIKKVEELLKVNNLFDPENIELLHHVNQALKAHTCMEADIDYVVKDNQIIIVDEFTGRLMPGRRWSDGLHQAIEAKEGLPIARENQTLASITFQNLFRLYKKLAGMTGTAATEAAEFKEIYKLDVVVIPTNMPLIRDDQSDRVFRNREEKYNALADDVVEINAVGQPILIGTISIEQSEALSRLLSQRKIEHAVLNAKHHEREASIVAQAGRFKGITIATNMAGRGTDIVLGGNPEGLAIQEFGSKDLNNPDFQQVLERYRKICAEEKTQVLKAGGLSILGTERHESRRIDNQLRGRAGRQGDPGMSRFYVSLTDDLMKRFGGDRIQHLMTRLGWKEGQAIDGRMISRSIEGAQKKVERFHFESRKHVTEYDDVMNKQRQVVYNLRNKVLAKEELDVEITAMTEDLVEDAILNICDEKQKPANWNISALVERLNFLFNSDYSKIQKFERTHQVLFDEIRANVKTLYRERVANNQNILDRLKKDYHEDKKIRLAISDHGEKEFDFNFESIVQDTVLENLDHYWNLHLQDMDTLRESIGLRGYGQLQPIHEYQKEGFIMFSKMLERLKEATVRKLYYYDANELEKILQHFMLEQQRRAERAKHMQLEHESTLEAQGAAAIKDPNEERKKLEAQRKARRRNR